MILIYLDINIVICNIAVFPPSLDRLNFAIFTLSLSFQVFLFFDSYAIQQYLLDHTTPRDWEYHSDLITSLTPAEIVKEAIREQLLENLPEEIPYVVQQVSRNLEGGHSHVRGTCIRVCAALTTPFGLFMLLNRSRDPPFYTKCQFLCPPFSVF